MVGATAPILTNRARGRRPFRRRGQRRSGPRRRMALSCSSACFWSALELRRGCSPVRCERRKRRPYPTTRWMNSSNGFVCCRACSALELYRRRCGAELLPDRIVRCLIADPLSPRSLRYALDEIARACPASQRRCSTSPLSRCRGPDVRYRIGCSGSFDFDSHRHGLGYRSRVRPDSPHGVRHLHRSSAMPAESVARESTRGLHRHPRNTVPLPGARLRKRDGGSPRSSHTTAGRRCSLST